jgi:hypothetical protein
MRLIDDTELYARLADYEKNFKSTESLDIVAFLQKLKEAELRYQVQRPIQKVELEGEVIDGSLVLAAPDGVALPFTLRGDTIILGDYHITVRLKGGCPPQERGSG